MRASSGKVAPMMPRDTTIPVAVTMVVAALQAVAGLWLGRALAPGQG